MVIAVNGHVFHGRPIIVLYTTLLSLPFYPPHLYIRLAIRSNWKRSYFSPFSRFSFYSHAALSVAPPTRGTADESRDFLRGNEIETPAEEVKFTDRVSGCYMHFYVEINRVIDSPRGILRRIVLCTWEKYNLTLYSLIFCLTRKIEWQFNCLNLRAK